MSKVVTERPRRGHANKSNKTGRKLTSAEFEKDDVGPARAPVSRFRQFGWDAKEFSDLIGPLRRSLRRNVGRPWNRVKSELSKTLDRSSMSGRHIWSHIGFEVQENCFIGEGGKVYDRGRWRSPHIATGLYVHPITGLLCWKARKRLRSPIEKPIDSIQIDEDNALSRIDGIWYHLGPARQSDAGIGLVRPKRQLNKKELGKHGLSNSDPTKGGRRPEMRARTSSRA